MTAHPDDESMFFGPALLCRHSGQEVKLLCLSTGNAAGLGETRKQELVQAAQVLGIPERLVQTVDDPELQDGMHTVWSPAKIEEVVSAEVIRSRIHTIVTFDEDGVSGHVNHRAVAHALGNASERGRLLQENGRPARLFQLKTTGIVRKFLGLLDIFFSSSEKYLFLAPAGGFLAVWKAMALHESQVRAGHSVPRLALRAYLPLVSRLQPHRTQFVWYRKAFVATSRYTYINTFTEVKPTSAVLAALAVKNGKQAEELEEEVYSEDEQPNKDDTAKGTKKKDGPRKRASKDEKEAKRRRPSTSAKKSKVPK